MAKIKSDFWKTDWFLGVVIVVLMFFFRGGDLMQSLERKAYDLGVKSSSKNPNDKIAIIAIDDQSINNIGRWPWSRDVHAKMTDLLSGAKAKVIGNTVFFFEPQIDPGLVYITKLLELSGGTSIGAAPATPATAVAPASGVATATAAPEAAAVPQQASPELAQFTALLKEAEVALNTDRKLAESYTKAGNVMLPLVFTLGDPRGKPDKPLPKFTDKSSFEDKNGDAVPSSAIQLPIDLLGTAAAGIGHLNDLPDVDGGIRTEPLVARHFDRYFPSYSLMIAAKSLNLGVADIKVTWGEQLKLGKLGITTNYRNEMYTFYYKDREDKKPFQIDSFYDVFTGKIPASKYADKIVLIGPTAAGVGTSFPTPVSAAMTPVEKMAHSVSSILSEHFFVAPSWAMWLELATSGS